MGLPAARPARRSGPTGGNCKVSPDNSLQRGRDEARPSPRTPKSGQAKRERNSDLSDASANAPAKLPNGCSNGLPNNADICPIPSSKSFVESCAELYQRSIFRNRKNLQRVRKDGCPGCGASVLARIGLQKKKPLESMAEALAQASDKSEFVLAGGAHAFPWNQSRHSPAPSRARLRPGRVRRALLGHDRNTPCARPRRSASLPVESAPGPPGIRGGRRHFRRGSASLPVEGAGGGSRFRATLRAERGNFPPFSRPASTAKSAFALTIPIFPCRSVMFSSKTFLRPWRCSIHIGPGMVPARARIRLSAPAGADAGCVRLRPSRRPPRRC